MLEEHGTNIIIRPNSKTFIDEQTVKYAVSSLSGLFAGFFMQATVLPAHRTSQAFEADLLLFLQALPISFVSGLVSALFTISILEYIDSKKTAKPLGYRINQEGAEVVLSRHKIYQVCIPKSISQIISDSCSFYREGRFQCIGSIEENITDDCQILDGNDVSVANYRLNDVIDGLDLGKCFGPLMGINYGVLIIYSLVPLNLEEKNDWLFLFILFLSISASCYVSQVLTAPVFNRVFNTFSDTVGASYKGIFFNVSLNQVREVFTSAESVDDLDAALLI